MATRMVARDQREHAIENICFRWHISLVWTVELAPEFEPELRFLKVDTEAEAELSARYNIRSIPTLMLFHRGNVVAQRAGAVGVEALRDWLRQHAPSPAPAAP